MAERDTYKYHLKRGNKVVHRGITNNLQRREAEHQTSSPGRGLSRLVGSLLGRRGSSGNAKEVSARDSRDLAPSPDLGWPARVATAP